MQRFFDIFFSGLALIFVSPAFIPIMILLRFTGEGEVFFVQSRVGRGGSNFNLYKFATMLKNSPSIGAGTVTVKNDPRVLPVGRFLRKTKVNELPQLINVLMGDMSVIGPRPQTRRCFEAFPPVSQIEIAKMRPGLSGLGSIVFRNEEDLMSFSEDSDWFYDQIIMPYKGRLEEWYVSNSRPAYYFIFIFLTIWVVLRPNSKLVWRIFPDLPAPCDELTEAFERKKHSHQ
jgi:lipopolysaccharide/colanic/teichoic acid biosynthesis glycosyltransferase